MLIRQLDLKGILSFGPESPPLPLQNLNVLIGPNGSGKSNLIEAIGFLRSSAKNLTASLRGKGGGVGEWIWKGADNDTAKVDAILENKQGAISLRHMIEFTETSSQFDLVDELIANEQPYCGYEEKGSLIYYHYQQGRPVLYMKREDQESEKRHLHREDVAPDESILSQRKDPDLYPELTYLANQYAKIRLYREWSFGRSSVFRLPQSADLPSDRLEEDFSNLGLFLNHLRGIPKVKKLILDHLSELYDGLTDFDVRIQGGTVEVFLTESDFIIPASRLSDGTLRYLCLLAILCDPDPPPLICIEEPELGLHPDMLPKIASLLEAASERTQLIVTTHSDILIDALTDNPEAVVVVEKHQNSTVAKRLENNQELKEMVEDYRLGQLWLQGEIGGVRW